MKVHKKILRKFQKHFESSNKEIAMLLKNVLVIARFSDGAFDVTKTFAKLREPARFHLTQEAYDRFNDVLAEALELYLIEFSKRGMVDLPIQDIQTAAKFCTRNKSIFNGDAIKEFNKLVSPGDERGENDEF